MMENWKKHLPAKIHKALALLLQYRLAISNFISLGLLRATDALILLFLIPVIIGRVGIDHFGAIAFVQVFLNYGKTIVSYGFNISGVQEVVHHATDKGALSHVFSNILFTRALLAIGVGLAILLLAVGIPYLRGYSLVFFWGYLLVLGQVVFADWFFIGLQQARYLTAANLLSKLFFAMLVIFIIHEPEDYVYVIGLQGGASLITGVIVIAGLKYQYGLSLPMPAGRAVRNYLRSDFKLLLTNLAIEANSSYSLLVLNILTTNALTGYFSVMQKLIQPLRFLLVIFSQAIFPVACAKVKEGWSALVSMLSSTLSLFFLFPIGATILMWIFAWPLLAFFAGPAEPLVANSFRLYLLVPVVVLANIPAYQILLAYGLKRAYSAVYITGLSINLVLSFFMAKLFGLYGLVTAILLVELFITLGLYFMAWKNRKIMKLKIRTL